MAEFLIYVLESELIRVQFDLERRGGVQGFLSLGQLRNLIVPYVEIEEQKQIVAHLKTETATIDTAIAKAEREIELIREYKEAMIAEAVMGKRK